MVFDGHCITTTSFRLLYQKLLIDTKRMLFSNVLLNLELPDMHHDHVHNELNNTEPGYSFISDKQNTFHSHSLFLLSTMLDPKQFGD